VIQLRQWAKENALRGNINLAGQQATKANEIF